MKRHLHYYVMPVAGNGTWQWNVEQLLSRIALFDGERVCGIATEEPRAKFKLDPPAHVKALLDPHGFAYVVGQNQRTLRETKPFVQSLELIHKARQPGDVCFFAHAKGVGRNMTTDTQPVKRWVKMLYELNLDNWPTVEQLLKTHPAAGAFMKTGRCFKASAADWHYSGSFYWLRLDDLFARDWTRIDHFMWGSEAYPGLHFYPADAGVIFGRGTDRDMNLYDPRTVSRIERDFLIWKSRLSPNHSRSGLSTTASRRT